MHISKRKRCLLLLGGLSFGAIFWVWNICDVVNLMNTPPEVSVRVINYYRSKDGVDDDESIAKCETNITINKLKGVIETTTVTAVTEFCTNPRRIYAEPSMYPLMVWWIGGIQGFIETITCSKNILCEMHGQGTKLQPDTHGAYLFYGSNLNFSDLPLPRMPHVIWALCHEESPNNVVELSHEKVLNMFNYSSTFSRFSDVPFPLQYMVSLENITSKEYFVETSVKNGYLNEIAPVLFLQSSGCTGTERDDYVSALMHFVHVDSYGKCLNNKQLNEDFQHDYLNKLQDDKLLRFVARYKFTIAIENGVCDDYVTEKLWRAIHVGSIPIYFGSPLIRDWLPNNKSAILLEDYPTPELMSEHIHKLMQDDNLYNEYLEHKTKEIISNKKLIYEVKHRPYQIETLERMHQFQCFVCQKLYENKVKPEVRNVNKSHYNCPKPISALTLKVNPRNVWVQWWESAFEKSINIYNNVMVGNKSKK